MDDDDRPSARGPGARYGSAGLLSGESLDSYSLDECDARIALLEEEIARVRAHRDRASAHRAVADALFRPKPS
jgi:uncharacterized small protein (DUF1192 family)